MPARSRPNANCIPAAALTLLALTSPSPAGTTPNCLPVWVQLSPATSPSPRFSPAIATNANDAIMFGGIGPNGINGELWRWNGSNWSLLTTSTTFARTNAAAVTVIPPGGGLPATLFYGGVQPPFTPLPDLLTWSPATGLISLSTDLGLGARFNHGWCGPIDESFNNLLIGGGDCGGTFATGHRVTLGGNIPVPPPATPANFYARSNFATAWDSLRNRAVIIHGSTAPSPCFAPTYDGVVRTWSPVDGWDNLAGFPTPRGNLAAAFSPLDALVVFGGETQGFPSPAGLLNDTQISIDGGIFWNPLPGPAPSPRRAFNNLAWVPAAEHFVLFGGHDGGPANAGYLGDTWVLTYRAITTQAPLDLTNCPQFDARFRAVMPAPVGTVYAWSFRWIDANTGFDSGWIDPPQAAACETFQLVINGKTIAQVTSVCGELLTLTRRPDLALADRVLVRRRAASPCAAAVISPQAEWNLLPNFNSDSTVDTADLIFFLGRFGQSNPVGQPILLADCNGDGTVNTPDLIFLLGRFGASCD